MKNVSRRDFLKVAATGAGGLLLQQLLASCGLKPTPPTSTGVAGTLIPTATASQVQPNVTAPPAAADLVVVHGGEPEDMLRQALAAFGGMQTFVPRGAKVVVKPNICNAYNTYEYASTTNPWVVGALVKLSLEAGASSVKVFDFPFGGTAEDAYVRSGIREQVEAAGGAMEIMTDLKFVPTNIPLGKVLKQTNAYQDALKADVLINVPIAKDHSTTRLTLGMKNLMGLVEDRNVMHSRGIDSCIADLTSLFRPELTVVDAVRILTANGPTGGNLDDVQKLDTIIVSPDIVAADSYATGLFGLTPEDIAYIPAAVAMGLGRSDLGNLKIQEIAAGA